jgi:hypothetical protein
MASVPQNPPPSSSSNAVSLSLRSLSGAKTGPGAAKPVSSETPTERAQNLIAVMDRLTDVMTLELDAVRKGALERVATIQAEKRALATRFDEVGRLLRLDRAGLAGLPPDVRTALNDASRRLGEVTMASAELLDIQGRAQKCVVDVVVKSVNHERRAVTAYGQLRKGIARPARAPASSGSMTFSATL